MAAVRTRNFRLLRPFIADNFFLGNEDCFTHTCGPEDVQQRLSTQDAWPELEKALHSRWQESLPSKWGHVRREIVDTNPCHGCVYNVYIGFEQDDVGQWHWVSWNYPGD